MTMDATEHRAHVQHGRTSLDSLKARGSQRVLGSKLHSLAWVSSVHVCHADPCICAKKGLRAHQNFVVTSFCYTSTCGFCYMGLRTGVPASPPLLYILDSTVCDGFARDGAVCARRPPR
jgi:hypothetical protein